MVEEAYIVSWTVKKNCFKKKNRKKYCWGGEKKKKGTHVFFSIFSLD